MEKHSRDCVQAVTFGKLLVLQEYETENFFGALYSSLELRTKLYVAAAANKAYYIEGRNDEVLMHGYKLLEALPNFLGYNDVKEMFNKLQSAQPEYIKDKFGFLNDIYRGVKALTQLTRHSKVFGTEMIDDHIKKADARYFIHSMELLIDYLLSDIVILSK